MSSAKTSRAGFVPPPRSARVALSADGSRIAVSSSSRVTMANVHGAKEAVDLKITGTLHLSFHGDEVIVLTMTGVLARLAVATGKPAMRETVCGPRPFGGVAVLETGFAIGIEQTLVLVDREGKPLRTEPLPGRCHLVANDATGRVRVMVGAPSGRMILGRLEERFVAERELDGGVLWKKLSPSGRWAFGFAGMQHHALDLSTGTMLTLARSSRPIAAFVDDTLLVEQALDAQGEWEVRLVSLPSGERLSGFAYRCEDIAVSADGSTAAFVGDATGRVMTRRELVLPRP